MQSSPVWTWERSTDQSTWNPITGETSHRYTPQTDDEHQYLRVTATYTDVYGSQIARAVPTTAVAAAPVVMLELSDDAIAEDGGVSTVTATLDQELSAETVVTVRVTAVAPATTQDFRRVGQHYGSQQDNAHRDGDDHRQGQLRGRAQQDGDREWERAQLRPDSTGPDRQDADD